MGLSRDTLEHLFRITESNFSEEGISALILVICGWLKSSEDKTLECAYCQRHLALRHFFSIAECSKTNDTVPVQSDLSPTNGATKMDVSDTNACKSFSLETNEDNSLDNMECKIESVHTLQQRKRTRRSLPAVHISTARHRASALACVTKQKFPSFCNILHLRYGIKLPKHKGFHKNKKCSGNKSSGNAQIVEDELMTNGNESACEKPTQELHYVDTTDVEERDVSQGNKVNKRKLPGENDTENKEICHIDKQQKVDGGDSEIQGNNSSIQKEGVNTASSMECDTEDIVHLESDSEMVTKNSASQNAVLGSSMTESNLPISEQHTSTHEIEEKGVSSSSVSAQNGLGTKEEIPAEDGNGGDTSLQIEENETVKRSDVSDSGKIGPNSGKRQLICDDEQQTEGTNKRMKFSVESSPLKKKNLNPVIEHRFWCIWRIKTVDRLLGSPKEGWRQILDLLKFGVSPPNSEAEEETADLFEEVKKIHYMMSGW